MDRRVQNNDDISPELADIHTNEGCKALTSPLKGHMPIYFGSGAISCLSNIIEKLNPDKIFILSDTHVYKLHGTKLLKSLSSTIPVQEILIPPGESQKSLVNLEKISEQLFKKGASRDSLILNFGGGVLLNIGGLAASLIYRGIRFIQIPTTLMSQSDVIISNKQTINFAHGKNRFGVFSTPKATVADPDWLSTEPTRQINAAMVEYCKNAIILGAEHYERVTHVMSESPIPFSSFPQIIKDALKQKFIIGEKDPIEKTSALILEYGHTVGHALEYLSQDKLLHGEAVYYGMKVAAQLSFKMGILPQSELDKQNLLLSNLTQIPPIPNNIQLNDLLQAVQNDNKKSGTQIQFILLSKIGEMHKNNNSYLTPVQPELLKSVLEESLYAML